MYIRIYQLIFTSWQWPCFAPQLENVTKQALDEWIWHVTSQKCHIALRDSCVICCGEQYYARSEMNYHHRDTRLC